MVESAEFVRRGTCEKVHHMQYVFRTSTAGDPLPPLYGNKVFILCSLSPLARKDVVIVSSDNVFLRNLLLED
jgi:hypothetical protein